MAPLPPYPRKRLGQHFLIDPNLLRKIVRLADLQPTDCVCEIGPGGGALTTLLCQTAKQVLALEVDPRMVELLKTELAEYANLDVQVQDALRYPFDQMRDLNYCPRSLHPPRGLGRSPGDARGVAHESENEPAYP